ncbi:cilia- and flagella-associated protein 45 isoform X3 [Anabas testudineus]|uniref:Cilia- and flagella-associated protein 45 n=1 Tax=Anabas testudineus TaxID=64144 RepID=A0A3Q1H2E3_ANATE|nr:cilia- and flagella-associated protein 45 isoform X2 [Anabas testudineus]XP_026225315.1 cilia- and flagella-associated protein 45 isoform X2 [Anabas testudineus]XP_026225325.1 cilia- and flagella-associated protein 45 isoform X3 [Anabas testudineus]
MRLASSSTNSRSSSHTRRYRTRAPTSEVDETLFGSPKPMPSDRREKPTSKVKDKSPKNPEGETVQIITKDLIRNLRIPWTDPSGESIILPSAEFERITSASRVLTKEEREALKDAYQRKKQEEIKAAEEKKRQICVADMSRKENQILTELELEARDRTQRLLERANTLRMEQEDEVKKLNQLILSAQCQATRDAQIQEKKQIQVELLEEEKRLDAMMEVERRKALETVEQIDELRKQQRISGMQQIYDQIQQRLEEKQLQEEMKEQERQQIRENQERMNLEDLKALEKKRTEQQQLQEEVMRINAETMLAKLQRREEEKLVDMRDMEYIQKKMERDAEYEAEQRRIKKEKELEIARLRARQEKAKDYKAEQDELRARRNQEINDRKWRMKEKELAEKKAQEEAMLRAARLEQVHHKEHLLSIEAGREKAEFERVLKVQQEAVVRQKEEEEKQHHKALRYSDAIRQQMKEREFSAIAKRRDIFKEADQLIEEARQRRMRLDEIKEKKLKELKATGLSEKYCSEVERKARSCIV